MAYQKNPPSAMIRVPTALIPAVRELSRLHREGHTIPLLQSIEDLIIIFDSSDDINIAPPNKSLEKIEEQLNKIELKLADKLDKIALKLEPA